MTEMRWPWQQAIREQGSSRIVIHRSDRVPRHQRLAAAGTSTALQHPVRPLKPASGCDIARFRERRRSKTAPADIVQSALTPTAVLGLIGREILIRRGESIHI